MSKTENFARAQSSSADRTMTTMVLVIFVALVPPMADGAVSQERPRDPVATVPDSGGAKVMVLGGTLLPESSGYGAYQSLHSVVR